MPHVGGGGGDDLASSDEIKVYDLEGDEQESKTDEHCSELKMLSTSLVNEGEEEKEDEIQPNDFAASPKNPTGPCRPDSGPLPGKAFEPLPPPAGHIGYVVSPYPHHNGSLGSMNADILQQRAAEQDAFLQILTNKVPMPPHAPSPIQFMMYNDVQPPPAHMGIPPVPVDHKTGIPRPPMYHLGPPSQYTPVFNPDFPHQLSWHAPALYPATSAGFRSAYSAALPVTSPSLTRFSPPTLLSPYPGISPHPGISHPALISAAPRQELPLHLQNSHSNYGILRAACDLNLLDPILHLEHRKNLVNPPECPEQKYNPSKSSSSQKIDKKNHIKKPLNAFMLYMKEMRAKVVAECTLKESAAINQILGRRWHNLSREEQAKYYEMARKERQLHMQLYPGWSARDNYAQHAKKKKRKKDHSQDGDANNLKKCRARFGLDKQSSWCKPCRRKKKCIRYMDGSDPAGESEDNMGSTGSVEAPTPESKSSEDSDTNTSHPSPAFSLGLASPSEDHEVERKPRLDSNGVVQEERPRNHHQQHHHQNLPHPLSVHHLIQPHFSSRSMKIEHCNVIQQLPTPPSTDSSTTTSAPPMLIVK